MFSFLKKYTEGLANADIYGDIGVLIFLFLFTAAALFALKANKSYISALAQQPLND